MPKQFSTAVRNAMCDVFETTTGVTPRLRLYSGSIPANCAAAATGTLLADIALPSDWLSAAASGTKTLLGSWQGVGAAAAGAGTVVGYYRFTDSAGTTCHEQGTVTVTGGGGDMTVDNVNIAQNQTIIVSSYSLTIGGA